MLRKRLTVAESATENRGRLEWGSPKTHQLRTVRLPVFVAEMLARHLESVDDDPDALVFTAVRGGPLRHSYFRKYVWKPAVETAAVPQSLTFHSLRHTAGSILIAQGADAKRVQAHLGHATITMTFDVYGHLFDDAMDDVMDRLDAAARERGAPQTPPKRSEEPVAEVIELPRREAK